MEPPDVVAALGAITTAAAAGALLVTRSPRRQVAALAVGLVAAPLTVAPTPGIPPVAFWIVAALLAAYLLLTTLRATGIATLGTMPLGGIVEAGFVALALGLAWAADPVAGVGRGSSAALAAGAAVAVAAAPLGLFARDAWRTALSSLLALEAAGLVLAGLAGIPGPAVMAGLALAIVSAAFAAREILLADGPDVMHAHSAAAATGALVRSPHAGEAPTPVPSARHGRRRSSTSDLPQAPATDERPRAGRARRTARTRGTS